MSKQKRRIKIQIQMSGAPYPNECWWRIVAPNGKIYHHSELMGRANAVRSIFNIVTAIKEGRYSIQTLPPKSTKVKK